MPADVTVSACLIVRDEEAFLDACLTSVAGHVHDIVVVDTGSRDASREIARRHGAVLLDRVWRDDFAWARNEGLDAARGDWILYIDADERLTVPAGSRLGDGLEPPDVCAAMVQFQPQPHTTPYREYRLFRNDPRIRFTGSMHESIVPAVMRLTESGGRIVDSPASIVHYGYDGDLTRKHHRNLPLLRTAVLEEPRRSFYWWHLSVTLRALGELDEALQAAETGLKLASTRKAQSERAIAASLAMAKAAALKALGRDGLPALEEGLQLYPNHPSLAFSRAELLLERGEAQAALEILQSLLALGPEGGTDRFVSHDRRIFGESAYELSAAAYLKLGQPAAAADAMWRAVAAAPDNLGYRAKAIALSRSGSPS